MVRGIKILLILLFPLFLIGQPVKNWTTQPPLGTPLNNAHSSCKGLLGCWLLNGGGQIAVDSYNPVNIGTLSSGAIYKVTQQGYAVNFTQANSTNQISTNITSTISAVNVRTVRAKIFITTMPTATTSTFELIF